MDGENDVIVGSDYPANVYPWMHLQSKGVVVNSIANSTGGMSVDEIASAVDGRTRLVAISFVHFATGFRTDLAVIGEFCRTRKIGLFVDAIQGLGVLPIDVKAMQIDYLCANSQKWLLAPQGAAVLFVDQAKIEKIRPISVGWKSVVDAHNYSQVDFRLRDDAARFECGSFIIPSIIALGGSLSLIEQVGISTIRDRVKEITDYVVGQLTSMGAKSASQRDGEKWSGIVSFDIPHFDPAEFVRRCLDQGVVISCRGERIRVSPHFYNNREDIDRLVNALR